MGNVKEVEFRKCFKTRSSWQPQIAYYFCHLNGLCGHSLTLISTLIEKWSSHSCNIVICNLHYEIYLYLQKFNSFFHSIVLY